MLAQHSTPGMIMGTLGYMSPEQAQGKTTEIDTRSDIFSFGCVLYEAVTRHKPFDGDSIIKSLHKVVYEPAPPITTRHPGLPPGLDAVLKRALAKSRDDRYPTCGALAADLRSARTSCRALVA